MKFGKTVKKRYFYMLLDQNKLKSAWIDFKSNNESNITEPLHKSQEKIPGYL